MKIAVNVKTIEEFNYICKRFNYNVLPCIFELYNKDTCLLMDSEIGCSIKMATVQNYKIITIEEI